MFGGKEALPAALKAMIEHDGPYLLDVNLSLPGACAPDDSRWRNGERHHCRVSFDQLIIEENIKHPRRTRFLEGGFLVRKDYASEQE